MLFNQSSILIVSMALITPLMGACGDVEPRWGDGGEDSILIQGCRADPYNPGACIDDEEEDDYEEEEGVDEPKPDPDDDCRRPGGCKEPKYDEGYCKRNPWGKGCPKPDWEPEPWHPDGGGDHGDGGGC